MGSTVSAADDGTQSQEPPRAGVATYELGELRASGRFEVGEQLGAGSTTAVYCVTLDGQVLAAKIPIILQDEDSRCAYSTNSQKALEMLSRPGRVLHKLEEEVRLQGLLRHRRIVPTIAVVYDTLYGVRVPTCTLQELARGGTLEQLIRPRGRTLPPERLPAWQLWHLFVHICEGLVYLQRKGILHQDLKPSNCLLPEGTGRLQLSDFGGAKAEMRRIMSVVASSAYTAPEVATEPCSFASDVYSSGVVLMEMGGCAAANDHASRLQQVQELAPEVGELVAELLNPAPSGRPAAEQAEDVGERRCDEATAALCALAQALSGGSPAASEQQEGDNTRALVTIAGEGPAGSRRQAMDALKSLSAGTSGRAAVMRAGGVQALVAIAGKPRRDQRRSLAVGTLVHLADDAQARAGIVEVGGLETLGAITRTGTPKERIMAAAVLAKFANDAANIQTCGPELTLAANALSKLADGADRRAAILQAGGVEALTAIARQGSPEGRTAAAEAIGILACDPACRSAILLDGGVEALLAILREGSSQGAAAAAAALANLADDAEVRASIMQADGLEALLAVAHRGSHDGRVAVAHVLLSLADDAEGKAAIIQAGGVEALVLMASKSSSAEGKTMATLALASLAADADGAAAIRHEDGVKALVAMARDGGPEGRVAAANALGHLSGDAGGTLAIMQAGGLEALVSVAHTGNLEGMASVAQVLARGELADGRAILQAGGVDALIMIAQEGCTSGRDIAAQALANLADCGACKEAMMLASGVVEALLTIARTGGHEGRAAAASALAKLDVDANDSYLDVKK